MEIRYTTLLYTNGYRSLYKPIYLEQLYNWHFTTGLGRETTYNNIKLSSSRPTLAVL